MVDMPLAQTDFSEHEALAGLELPIAGAPAPERCAAVRNRRRILETAQRLFATEGVEGVSLERIASEAGVGKGTVFRRFGDRAGLLYALLSEREAAFQEACIRGPAPLGPAADPVERLIAFGEGQLELLDSHGELMRAAQSGRFGERYASPPYMFQRAHVSVLLNAAVPGIDADWAADALLALLAADLFVYQRDAQGLSAERQAEGWRRMVLSLTRS